MSLEGGKVLCYGENGKVEKILQPSEKIFTIGYYMSCDVIHEHPEVKGIHCEIACDSFGRITVKNYCETHPIIVNGETVAGTRPLLTGSTIEVVGKHFKWEYEPPKKEEDATQATPDAKANKVQQAPTSEPSAPTCRTIPKRLTVHSFAYGLNSNREEDIENPSECSIIQPIQMKTNREIIENQSSANLIDISLINKENHTPKRRLSICSHSEIVVTSYSPRPGLKNTPKGFACVTPAKKTPKSLYATPRSALSEYNQSTDSMDFATPKTATPKLTTSMYLIDLTTPLNPPSTSSKKTPLLKSALKNSVKDLAKTTAKKATFTGGTNLQGRKIALETPAKKGVSATPKRFQQNKLRSAEEESNTALLDSIIEQYTINSSSMSIAEDSSVIEISSDGTPNRLKEKKPPKTPQLLVRKAIITSTRKVKTAEKGFANKIKNNIERISENLSTIGNIKGTRNRRSSLPAMSAIGGRQSLMPPSSTGKLSKLTATPRHIPTTSTPFRSRKSLSTMMQSTPLKTPQKANLAESFRRNSCITSNQTTPKLVTKTPRRSIMKSQETKTPKKGNSSVLFIDKPVKSVNQLKENDKEDTLNATFTVDEEEEILVSKLVKQIGDYLVTDGLEHEKLHSQTVVDKEIQLGISSPPSAACEQTPQKIRRSASFTIESPAEVQNAKNVITRSVRKQIAEDTPIETLTDLKGLKQLLSTPRGLNRTPNFVGVKELLQTPKVEESKNKMEFGNKTLMKTPIKTQNASEVRQLFKNSKVIKEENLLGVKELLKTPKILKNSDESFVGIKEVMKTPKNSGTLEITSYIENSPVSKMGEVGDILNSKKNELEPSLRRSASFTIKTTNETQIDVLENENSFTKNVVNPNLDITHTPVTEPDLIKRKSQRSTTYSTKTPNKVQTPQILVATEIQSDDIPQNSDISSNSVPATPHGQLHRCSTFNIATPKKLGTVDLKADAEVQKYNTPERSDIKGTPISTGYETLQRKLRRSTVYKMKTQTNLNTPEKTIVDNPVEVQSNEIRKNAGIQSTPPSGQEHIRRRLRRSSKIIKPTNLQTPEKPIVAEDTVEVQSNEVINYANIQITPASKQEHIQKQLRGSSNMKTPTNLHTPKNKIAVKDYAKAQKTKISENADILSTPVLGNESIQRKRRRSSISKTKTPTNLLTQKVSPALKDYEETQNIDTPVGQPTISKAETPRNEQTSESSIALEDNTETQSSANLEQSDFSNKPLVPFKPVLRKIWRSSTSKMKTPINHQTSETPIPLEDDAETQKTEIPENADLPSGPVGQVQCTLQISPIIKTELPINLQSSGMSSSLEDDAGNQSSDILEHSDTTKLLKDVGVVQTGINTSTDPKRNSLMVVGQAVELLNKKANRRHTMGALMKKSHSEPTDHYNSFKTDLNTSSKNLNNVEESFTGKRRASKTDDNIKFVDYKEDKNNSFSSLRRIKSGDFSKENSSKSEPGKLFKSATFIIDSTKRSNIVNSLAQKESDDCESAHTLTENVKPSEQLFKPSENVKQTPDRKETQKLLKTPVQTPIPLGVKELFNTPKPLQDVNFVGVKELMKTPKVATDSEDNYHGVNELLQTPKYSKIREETPSKSFKDDITSELEDYETLLIEDESYPPSPTTSQVELMRVLQRKYRSYPTSPIVEAKTSSTKSRKSVDFFTETEEDICSTESVKAMEEFEREQMADCESSNTETYNYSTTSIVGLKKSFIRTQKSVGFYIETEEDVCSAQSLRTSMGEYLHDQREEYESSDIETDVPSIEFLKIPHDMNITSKSQKKENFEPKNVEKTTAFIGVKELINTPKDDSSEDIREFGLRVLMKTPTKTPNPVRIKALFNSPKPEKEENFVGVKELMNEPKNLDQTVVMLGVKELLKTPQNESFNEIRELGLKKLMKTPAKTPKPVKIKNLFQSPKPEKDENFEGVKELMNIPKNLDEPTFLVGVKELVKTPKNVKSPRLLGVKEMFNSPKTIKEPRLGGVKELMRTPENLKDSDINLIGVKEILKTPKNNADTEDFLGLPEMFSTPHHRLIITKKDVENLMKSPVVKFQDQEIDQISRSPKNFSPGKQINDIAFKTPSAKMVMVLGTPQSVNINTEKTVASAGPPPVYDLKENMEDIEEIFPTDVIETEESETLSAEDSFDKYVGRPIIRKSYGRSSMPHKNSSFKVVESGENERLPHSSEEVDENSRDVGDNAAVFSMSGIRALEREEEESEELEVPKNSEVEDFEENAQIANINENQIVEKIEEGTKKMSYVIILEHESATTSNTKSRGRIQKKVESPQKQSLDVIVPTQIKTRRGQKKNDTLNEFQKDAEVQVNKQDIDSNVLNELENSEHIPEVKATRGRIRKRKISNNEADKEKTSHKSPEKNLSESPQTKRATRNMGNLKTQIPNELNSYAAVELPRSGRRGKVTKLVEVKVSEKVVEEELEVEESNQEDPYIELEDEEDIKFPQPAKENEHVLITTPTANKNDELDDDNKSNISISLSSSDDKPFILPIMIKTRGQRNPLKGSAKTKSSPVKKRKSDSESEESVVPVKRMVRKRGVNAKDEAEQHSLEIKAVTGKTRRKPGTVLEQENLTKTEVKTETIPPSKGNTAKENVENFVVHEEDFSEKTESAPSQEETTKSETENISEDANNLNIKAKIETTPPRRGRAKRKADNNLTNTELGSSSTESEAPPVRRGRSRRKADNIEPQEQNPEHKTQNTPSRRGGSRRKVEDLVGDSEESSDKPKTEVPPPQRGRSRRKADNILEEPKAERTPPRQKNPKEKASNLLNMSTDELTPINPASIKNPSEEKENVSTPKSQPKNTNTLEFKTPMSAAPRARRVLRSNSTSVQNSILTPVLQEHNQQEIIVIDDSIEKIDSSLSAAASTRTRGRRRLNSTKDEVETSETEVEKLETSISGLPAAKSGRTRGRPRINSTKEEVPILNESETSENALPSVISGRTRGRKRINSTKDEIKFVDVNVEQPEKSGRTRGRKNINTAKEGMKDLGIEIEKPEVSEIGSAIANTTRTRGRKKINSTKEEVEIPDVDKPDASENVPDAETLGRRKGKGKITSTKEEQLEDPNVGKAEAIEKIPPTTASGRARGRPRINSIIEEVHTAVTHEEHTQKITSGRTRGRRNANSAKKEVQIVDANEEQPQEELVSTRTRTTRRKKAS